MNKTRLSSRELWTALALMAACLAILASAPAQYLGRQQDDLLYVIGAQALTRGHFRLETVPGMPALTQINIGFPLLLLPVALLFGERFIFFQIYSALMLAAVPIVFWLWRRKKDDGSPLLLCCLLFATHPVVLSQAGTVMSETPFTLATLLLLWSLDQSRLPAASGCLLALTQIRAAGLALLPAAAAGPLRAKNWRQAALILGPAVVGAVLSVWWSLRVSGAHHKIAELVISYSGRPFFHIAEVAADNARFYFTALGSAFLPRAWGGATAGCLAGAAFCALSLRGAAQELKRDAAVPGVWVLAVTALLHLFWPWQYERYLIMPLPLLLWTAARGLGPAARPALAALLAAQVVFQARFFIGQETSWTKPELLETYSWLKAHSRPEDIIASPLYVRDGFYAARPGVPVRDSATPQELATQLSADRARFVVWQEGLDLGLSLSRDAAIQGKLDRAGRHLRDASAFALVYDNPVEGSRIYRVK